MDQESKIDWLRRFLTLLQENPHAEITILTGDELTLSYGPDMDDEVEIGDRRKCNLTNIQDRIEAIS